jgi:indolepyruvate ferredoxin oxidoreductase beta subunit
MTLAFDPINIIISGVGGQGNILASDLISRAFCNEDYFVSVGETYGATQRGGSVFSHVRLSKKHIYGPLIPSGEGHVIIGFEPLEVYRILLEYGHEHIRIVMNDRPFYPLDTLRKQSAYPDPEKLVSNMKKLTAELKIIKGTELARQAGHPMAQNVVMVGAFAGLNWIPLAKKNYRAALQEIFSDKRLDLNEKAFEYGFQAGAGAGATNTLDD